MILPSREPIAGCGMFSQVEALIQMHCNIMENIIIALIFLSAIFYLGNMVRKNFSLKNKAGCSKGCGSCGAIDFNKIEAQILAQKEQ